MKVVVIVLAAVALELLLAIFVGKFIAAGSRDWPQPYHDMEES